MATAPHPTAPPSGYEYTLRKDYRDWPPNLKAAWLAARAGFFIIPCSATDRVANGRAYRAKQPLISKWKAKASRDPDMLIRWWKKWPDALPALHLELARLIVIDADRHGGPDGVANFEQWAAENEVDLTIAPMVETPNDGKHFYYSLPDDFAATNSTGSLPPGIDVRGPGYVIAPYAQLPDGRSWSGAAPEKILAAAADLPDALAAAIGTAKPHISDRGTPLCELDTDTSITLARAYLDADGGAVEGNGGDQQTYVVACCLRDFGVSEPIAVRLMFDHWNDKCAPPWDHDDLERKVSNTYAYAKNPPGVLSSLVQFGGVEIVEPMVRVAPEKALWWADDASADQPMRWLLKGLLPRNGVGILYGAPKSGKSFVVLDLAARLACVLPWFDVRCPNEAVGTLFLLGEGAGTVRTRLKAFCQSTGAAQPHIAWATVTDLATKAGQQEATALIAAAKAGMELRGVRLALVVIDTLASGLGLEDENSAPEVTKALKMLEGLALKFDLAVLGVHHAGKNGQDRGSSAFRAACDVMMSVERAETVASQPNNYRQLSIVLNRNGESEWSANFKLDRVRMGIDEDGDEISSCIVTPVREPAALLNRRQAVLALFDPETVRAHGMQLSNGAWALTRRRLANQCAEIWDDLSKDALRKAVNRATTELVETGCIAVVEQSGVRYFVASKVNLPPPSDQDRAG